MKLSENSDRATEKKLEKYGYRNDLMSRECVSSSCISLTVPKPHYVKKAYRSHKKMGAD